MTIEKDGNTLYTYENLAAQLLASISELYWSKMYAYIQNHDTDMSNFNCFILNPDSMVLYFGQNYIAMEYCGNPYKSTVSAVSQRPVEIRDFTKEHLSNKQFIEKIIGFHYTSTSKAGLTLHTNIYEDLIIPTNAGVDKLIDLQWNFAAQSSIMSFNSAGLDIADDQFVRLINCRFFDEQNGDLKTRIIKWIDFIPCRYIEPDSGELDEIRFSLSFYNELWYHDLFYQYPRVTDFKYAKLPQINRFIEFFGDSSHSETDITSFLGKPENKFILKMAFMGTDVFSETTCVWQSEVRDTIRPDFFVLHANGCADIIEFKLPNLKNKSIVGKSNREHFSSEISTYDDLVDTVLAQFYQ